jgi:hypothetical protein
MARLRHAYGAGPLHLIAALAAVAIAGYAFLEIAERPAPLSFLVFFAGAIVAHDLIAFPIYSALDRLAGGATTATGANAATVNYVRVPALLSGFALIVWFPLILGLDRDNYEAAAGIAPPDFLGRWLILTAALFLGSGLLLALRQRRSARDRDRATDHPGPRSRR